MVAHLLTLVQSEYRLWNRQLQLWTQMQGQALLDPDLTALISKQIYLAQQHISYMQKKQDMLEQIIHKIYCLSEHSDSMLEDVLRQLKQEF